MAFSPDGSTIKTFCFHYLKNTLDRIQNDPNKLECYIKQGWKGLSGTNSLAYWAHL